jgi:hypothetical protein
MTRKLVILVLLAAALGRLSLCLHQDWFAKDSIQIYHRSQPIRAGWLRRAKAPVKLPPINPIYFSFDRRLKLTSLKVVSIQDTETNKYPHPVWALISDSNSVPTKDFMYGVPIRGMRPPVKGATPDPLVPGVKYRLLVEAGAQKAAHDFEPVARTP